MKKNNCKNINQKMANKFIVTLPKYFLLLFLFVSTLTFGLPKQSASYVSSKFTKGDFTLSASGSSAPWYGSSKDYPGVILVLKQLQTDVTNVTGAKPEISIDKIPSAKEIVIAGTIGKNPVIDQLIKEKKLNVDDISGKWETFLITVIEKPFPNVDRALVIAGSDKRGTIYGMYDLSSQIGVSPWYWWADVPVKKLSNIYILPGRHSLGEPKVKYRGIFLNDEAPALTGWVHEKFGDFNSKFYVHVFELLLRLKGNFLWPAMWNNSFDTDDTLNPKLANEYGIVMGTSHHEPMMRAWKEWERAGHGRGSWDYSKNKKALQEYWKEGIERTKNYEEIVTLAMRGDGDEAMSPDANVSLLEQIVKDQRKILSEVTGKDVTTIPQVWALYKEVQEYYNKGMRVPDDVTLLLCDDNWGNVRKLPKLTDPPRKGGYGMYYHFDFVGGPRCYRWLNTTQIERVWEEMHLSYKYGVDRIWIVNVGDLKPMEFPISFFLDYAWNPDEIPAESLPEYYKQWAEKQFGPKYADQIAEILEGYTKYNSRRKPELLAPNTYSLVDYREAEKVVDDYNSLEEKAEKIHNEMPEEYKDAFYQLVLHPVQACSNLNDMYVTIGKNRLYAEQGRAETNILAEKAKNLFERDADITAYYNHVMANGKWNHMMDQTHIGYTSWQEPPENKMPQVKEIDVPDAEDMGVAIEGSDKWWPNEKSEAVLPPFDTYNQQSYYIEIFNRGKESFKYSAKAGQPCINIDAPSGNIDTGKRLWVNVDWKKAPKGSNRIPITVLGPNNVSVIVYAVVDNPESPKRNNDNYFVESNGYVSIEAENYTKAVNASPITWLKIPNLGRTNSAMTMMPVRAASQTPGGDSPHLEYRMYLFSSGEVNVEAYLSPLLNFGYTEGRRFAISFDNNEPQVINVNKDDTIPDWRYPQYWNQEVSNNIKIVSTKLTVKNPGLHVLKFWAVDSGPVLQKIVIDFGGVKQSYLGPPQSFNGALVK